MLCLVYETRLHAQVEAMRHVGSLLDELLEETHSEQDKYIMNVHDFTTSGIEVNAVNYSLLLEKTFPAILCNIYLTRQVS